MEPLNSTVFPEYCFENLTTLLEQLSPSFSDSARSGLFLTVRTAGVSGFALGDGSLVALSKGVALDSSG